VILRELGFDPQAISRFRAGGAIKTAGRTAARHQVTWQALAVLYQRGRSGSAHF